MGVKVQARVASALEAPVKVEAAQPASIDREAMWGRMDAHGFSQNEVARRAGISSSYLSHIMNGKSSPSAGVLKGLHGVLFQPTSAERVMPAEVKVLGWRKGERSGDGGARPPVAPGAAQRPVAAPFGSAAGCPGARRRSTPTARGTTAGAGSRSLTSSSGGYSAMLKQPETAAA